MISSISGTVDGIGADWVNVSVGGVTLKISVPSSAVSDIGRDGDFVKLFTLLQVRDDSLTLYGFATEDQRSVFISLIQVNGVGPKVALSILSTLTIESLNLAIGRGDADSFRAVPGVGAKTANRIVLELKGKLELTDIGIGDSFDTDVVQALTALGYSIVEATEAASSISGNELSVEEQVRLAIQNISNG